MTRKIVVHTETGKFSFKKVNFEGIWRDFNDINWSPVQRENNIGKAIEKFYETVELVLAKIFPDSIHRVKQGS